MFGSSTQKSTWTFKNEDELTSLRAEANRNYIRKFQKLRNDPIANYLSPEEELVMVKEYNKRLRQFCHDYRDPRDARVKLPPSVISTATHYFLRYYLYNSIMDQHPKYIMHTCIYLACKIEEVFVPINDYIYNVEGTDKEKSITATAILNSELQTTQELQFHLIIHQPYRPVEGLLIDIKTRYEKLSDPEALRSFVEEFLEKVHHTDAILLYTPSQLALAAATTAASKLEQNLDSYVTDILFADRKDKLASLIDAVRKIKKYVKSANSKVHPEVLEHIEAKIRVCQNPENNPNTEEYRLKQAKLEQDDEEMPLVSCTAAQPPGSNDEDEIQVLDSNNTDNDNSSDEYREEDEDCKPPQPPARYSRKPIQPVLDADPWGDDGNQGFYEQEVVGGVVGVGLNMRSASGVVVDGGVIDSDDDCIVEDEDMNMSIA